MNKILIVCLIAAFLVSSVGGTIAFAEADTRALKTVTVSVILNEGVQSIGVCMGSTYVADLATVYTSDKTFNAVSGKTYSWQATAKDGYCLKTSSGTLTVSSNSLVNEISPIAYVDTVAYYTLTVKLNEGVATINVTSEGTTTAFTSNGTLTVEEGKVVSWSAKAKSGYTLTTSSGQFAVGGDSTISPTATVESFTVTATVTPSDVSCTLGWTLEWASGKSLTGAVSDYVTMTIASDGKSVTLTFKKNFAAGEMVLTCYVVGNTSVKATCTVTCGS